MKQQVTASVLLALGWVALADGTTLNDGHKRDLQSLPPSSSTTVPKGRKKVNGPLLSYPDDVQIDYNANLKCGACIRGNYLYCVNGKEGDADLSTKQQVCCQSAANCPQATNSAWTCSNTYQNKMLAKNLCPFNKANCGPSSNISFAVWNMQDRMKIELEPGDTCSYFINAECGVPGYKPDTTLGFDIESIDYTDADIGNVRRRRVLTSTDGESIQEEEGFLSRDLEEALEDSYLLQE